MKRTVSLILPFILAVLLLPGCGQIRFPEDDPIALYDREQIIEPEGGGKFALKEKRYVYGGYPVLILAVENLNAETYDLSLTVMLKDADGNTVWGNAVNVDGLSAGARAYRFFEPGKEFKEYSIRFFSSPSSGEGWLDKIEIGRDVEIYAHAKFIPTPDGIVPDPAFGYSAEYSYRLISDENVYYQGTLFVLDRDGGLFEMIPVSGIAQPGVHNVTAQKRFDGVPWDDGFEMPERARENVTGFIAFTYIDPKPFFTLPETSK